MDVLLQPGHFLREFAGHARQHVPVNLDARHFHPRQNRHKGALQCLINLGDLGGMQPRLQKTVQAQSHVGIFSRIGRGAVDLDAVEGNLRFSGADQIFYRDALVVQITVRQRVHAVPVQTCMLCIGQQHRVIDRRHSDALTGKNLEVVFHVLPDLQDARILQHRFEHLQRAVQRYLPFGQRVGVEQIAAAGAMRQRHIAGDARFGSQRHADQIGAHFVKRCGLRIDRDRTRPGDPVQPDLQRSLVAHDLICRMVDGRIFYCFGRVDHGCGLDHGRGFLAKAVGDATGQAAKLHAVQKIEKLVRLRIPDFQVVQRERQVHLAIQLHQTFGQFDLRAVVDQGLAALGLLDLIGAVQKLLQRSVFLDQLRGGLDTDARRARHVIHRIPRERLHIHDPVRRDTKPFKHTVVVDALVFHRVQHFDAAADQLHQVLVRRQDRDAPARVPRLMRKRGDDVVRFEPGKFFAGDVEGQCRFARQRDLRA